MVVIKDLVVAVAVILRQKYLPEPQQVKIILTDEL
jgi:hypothetical protein